MESRSRTRDVVRIGPDEPTAMTDLHRVLSRRGVLRTIVLRDLRLRYAGGALPLAWILAQPVLLAAVFLFAFNRLSGVAGQRHHYFAFALVGAVQWVLFTSIVQRASSSVLANDVLLRRSSFPRFFFPLASAVGSLVDWLFTTVLAIVILKFQGEGITGAAAVAPLWGLLTGFVGLGVGTLAYAAVGRFRDLAPVVPLGLQLTLFVTPIAYAPAFVPDRLQHFLRWNPLTPPVQGLRSALIGTAAPKVIDLFFCLAVAGALVLAGFVTVNRSSRRLVDVL